MSEYLKKLALGTVQFGLAYGISNARGQVPVEEVREILRLAAGAGVRVLDTAYAYGESEAVLGECLGNAGSLEDAFRIVSKFPPGAEQPAMAEVLGTSLDRLGQQGLYGYLFHSLDSYLREPDRWQEMLALKAGGRVERIGFSLYQPQDALDLLDAGLEIGLVQVPFSVLDQRWRAVFPQLKAAGVEIHVRSAFLQGLVFQAPAALDPHFAAALPALTRLRTLSAELDLPIAALCLGFAVLQEEIDQVVIGVADPAQFQENLALVARSAEILPALQELQSLAIADEQILLPMHWPR